MRCFVVAGFLLTSASHGPSAIAERLLSFPILSYPIVFCDPKYCACPRLHRKIEFLRGLLHMMSIPGYCIARDITVQRLYIFPIFTPKQQNRRFQEMRKIFKLLCYYND